jgi:hypothetical protein
MGMAAFAKEVIKYPDAMKKLSTLIKLLATDVA